MLLPLGYRATRSASHQGRETAFARQYPSAEVLRSIDRPVSLLPELAFVGIRRSEKEAGGESCS